MPVREISRTLKQLHKKNPVLQDRIGAVSSYFLGTPYKLGPLGEGKTGEFDQDPLVSFKAADCTTLVEEVMALSLEPDLSEALKTLRKIRYRDGRVSYETRNHFPETDWIANNVRAGFLRDITRDVAGDRTRLAHKLISKRDWYASKTREDLKGFSGASPEELEEKLKRFRELGRQFQDEVSTVPYVPIDMLFSVIDKIPSGTIANLVREDVPDKPILISHQVLIIEKDGGKYVRHAAYEKKVEDVPALKYFDRYAGAKWRLIGINLNRIIPPPRP